MSSNDYYTEVIRKAGVPFAGDQVAFQSVPAIEDFSGNISNSAGDSFVLVNEKGYAHIGFYLKVPTSSTVQFEGTFVDDDSTWVSISLRGIESNIFISSTDLSQHFIGSIVGLKKVRFRTTVSGSGGGSIEGRLQFQQSTLEGVEHQNDTDIGKSIVDIQNSQLSFYGKSEDVDAATSDASWQIKRVLKQGSITTTQYAAGGQYNQIWDNRESLFESPGLTNPASLLFDGSDEYITLGDNYTFGPATAFSWSFWMKAQNFAAQRCFIGKTSQDANVYGYSFQHDSSGKLFAQMRALLNLRQNTYNTTLTAGQWYHIVFTYAGGSNISGLLAYINATQETAPASAATAAWTVIDPLTFAARGNTFYFSGNMNQITVFNKALSQAEVTELYNGGSPIDINSFSAIANVLSHWNLNTNDTFPTEVDVVGAVNGTLTNMESTDYDEGDVP